MAETKELTLEEVKDLQLENKKMEAELTRMSESLAKNAELVKSLSKKADGYEKLLSENTALKAEVSGQVEIIAELNIALAAKEDENEKLSKFPVIAYKSKKYELVDAKSTARFNGKNVLVTVQTLKEVPGLLEHCIKKGFSCLKEKAAK